MTNVPLSAYKKTQDLLFLSGQIGLKDGKLISDNLEEQVVQAIRNIKKLLKDNNLKIENIVDVTVFLINQNDYEAFNEVYSKEINSPFPTRTVVTVKSLPLGAKVELKVIALLQPHLEHHLGV